MLVRLGLFALALSSGSAAMSMQSMEQSSTYPPARSFFLQPLLLPEPPTAVQQAARAFGRCVDERVRSLPATISADAGAASLMNACAAPLQDVARESERVIAASGWPEDRKNEARAELRARLAQVEQRVLARISETRLRTASASR